MTFKEFMEDAGPIGATVAGGTGSGPNDGPYLTKGIRSKTQEGDVDSHTKFKKIAKYSKAK